VCQHPRARKHSILDFRLKLLNFRHYDYPPKPVFLAPYCSLDHSNAHVNEDCAPTLDPLSSWLLFGERIWTLSGFYWPTSKLSNIVLATTNLWGALTSSKGLTICCKAILYPMELEFKALVMSAVAWHEHLARSDRQKIGCQNLIKSSCHSLASYFL
jgi:hypothetical protein